MKTILLMSVIAGSWLWSTSEAWAVRPLPDEMANAQSWVATAFGETSARNGHLPFTFVYNGKPAAALMKTWTFERGVKTLDRQRTQYTVICTDPKTGLLVRFVAVEYADYPVVEWTVYFKNVGDRDTPLLQDILGLDITLHHSGAGEFILHGIKGDWCAAESYQPYQLTLAANAVKKFAPPRYSGKSCDGPDGWPYYNLQMPGGGVILAIGWPGQWASTFTRDAANSLRITAGQQLTHLFLKPGEEIRTPLIAMLFWQGTDVVRAQNVWRRWCLTHNIPHINGRPQPPLTQIQGGGGEADIVRAEEFLKIGIQPDICWRDAPWYPISTGPYKGNDAWLNTGTWEPDPTRYPKGFKPFSDWVHAHGMKFLLWFEPERVGDPNSWLGKNHPEWLLPGTSTTAGAILDEGNPAALKWLIDHVDGMIKSQGLDWYREDMNGSGPLPAWRKHDADDRQGITENRYVQGHLAFWDELRRRNPHLCIDSCASGGRRNDLETMRRSVPLLRSDFQFPTMKGVVEANQGHTYGLSFWLPFQGTGVYLYDTYSFRSFYLPAFGVAGGLSLDNAEAHKKAYSECAKIAPYMLFGDYYPLTPYSLQLDQWIAWQFDRPEAGEGLVQAFRRGQSDQDSLRVKLHGLETEALYTLTNFDVAGSTKVSGRELRDNGLAINVKDRPGAAVITYQKKR